MSPTLPGVRPRSKPAGPRVGSATGGVGITGPAPLLTGDPEAFARSCRLLTAAPMSSSRQPAARSTRRPHRCSGHGNGARSLRRYTPWGHRSAACTATARTADRSSSRWTGTTTGMSSTTFADESTRTEALAGCALSTAEPSVGWVGTKASGVLAGWIRCGRRRRTAQRPPRCPAHHARPTARRVLALRCLRPRVGPRCRNNPGRDGGPAGSCPLRPSRSVAD
jgi:hypothetical protein